MDEMRKKRNRATYDMAGLISDTEARESVKIAKDFVLKITKIIDKLNPQKKLQLVNRWEKRWKNSVNSIFKIKNPVIKQDPL